MASFSDVQAGALLALYRLLQESDEAQYFNAASIKDRAGFEVGAAFISRVLAVLLEENLVSRHHRDGALYTLKVEGFSFVERLLDEYPELQETRIPASDRFVELGHNQPEYIEIQKSIDLVSQQVREWNGDPEKPYERERLLASLDAAKSLWSATDLKIIQVKVGILMVVEDAQVALSKTLLAVGGGILVDLIKGWIKGRTGIDLDHI